MPKYDVEEIDGETVIATHVIGATTPLRAAQEATQRSVTLRTNQTRWIKVTDEQRGHSFQYAFAE